MTISINRSLDDKAMDNIDHALGRPLDPMSKSYRNFYMTDGELAEQMASSPFWYEGRRNGDLRAFAVTAEGRKALAAHLRDIGDRHRAYAVDFDGHVDTVVATSRNKARYSRYLDIADFMPDLKFKDFCRRVSVRLER